MIFFNATNVVFSASLTSSVYALDMAMAGFAAVTIIGQVVHVCVYYNDYLGFDSTFDLPKVRFKTYIGVLLASRFPLVAVPAALRAPP